MAVVKKRNWAFVAYPDSLPADWVEQLVKTGVQFCVSPLHNKDFNPDGELKKPHYHVILVYGNPTTFNNVKSLTDRLHQPIPQALEQVRGYYRYLTHKDNPEKAQYNETDIRCYNGFNIRDFVELTSSEKLALKAEILALIREKQFTEYSSLIDYLLKQEMKDELDVASCNTIFFNTYLSSKRNAKIKAKSNELDKLSRGEI